MIKIEDWGLSNETINLHNPVMVNEVLEYLNVQEDKIYVDCTLGTGGHSIEILKRLSKGTLIGIEKDPYAFSIAKERLKDYSNCHLFNLDYIEIKSVLKNLNLCKITGGILLDLGVNSLQIDDLNRGFSFNSTAPLDMRMDTRQNLTAHNIINHLKEKELADIIYNYGEERFSRRIAKKIVENRPIKTTNELSNIILRCYPKHKKFKIHPATRTFQAIRILVNNELEHLEKFLCFTPELLSAGSRLTVISFHSLEDRIVKRFFKEKKDFKILTKKPLQPTISELKENPRSRSAKLRAIERI